MASTLAWLDQSAEQQRRARELVKLFSESESRDELGIGQIRDVYSERLFPGTSVIQTRARYFLFVPWFFQLYAKPGRSGAEVLTKVQKGERRFIETLRVAGEERGVIGIRKGIDVKILPSAIYWGGLTRYGILTSPLGPDEVGAQRAQTAPDPDAAEELVWRGSSIWHRDLPSPPPEFPDEIPGGLSLTAGEATWYREVVDSSAPATLLGLLLSSSEPPIGDTPWEDPVALSANDQALALLDDARQFSLKGRFVQPRFGFIGRDTGRRPGDRRPTRQVVRSFFFDSYEGGDPPKERSVVGGTTISTRLSRQGRITVLNRGPKALGYQICGWCGFMASGLAGPALEHDRPRDGKKCEGSLRRTDLGHWYVTDTIELTLPWTTTEEESLSTLHAVLAASASVGVENSDINGTLRPASNGGWSMVLFDSVPGGAGHCRRIADRLEPLFLGAVDRVANCDCGVETSCYGCLRSYRNQFDHERLERGLAIDQLKKIGVL